MAFLDFSELPKKFQLTFFKLRCLGYLSCRSFTCNNRRTLRFCSIYSLVPNLAPDPSLYYSIIPIPFASLYKPHSLLALVFTYTFSFQLNFSISLLHFWYLEMEVMNEVDFLSLSLAIVTNSNFDRKRNRKRKGTPENSDSSNSQISEEGKIFTLLQMREQMLKLDHKRSRDLSHGDGKGLHLIHLLLIAATSTNEISIATSADNLCELYQNVSLTGDSVRRVAAYFADGLLARLLTRKSPFYDMIMKSPTQDEEFFAFTELYKVSPFYQFAHFTANQAILEAFEREEHFNNRALHVIDFDISYGFQWPSLMQSLSEKATSNNRIFLKITGYGKSLEAIQETETRLVSFAKGFRNLIFEFYGLVRGSKLVRPKKKKNETLAVNLVLHLHSLYSFSKISDTLNLVHSLSPSIVVLVEQEGSRNNHNFLSRFMESLHYFAAIFDSLDDCLPLESAERLVIEKHCLGKEIKSVINDDRENEKCARFEKMETWKGRMESHGFLGIKQSSKSVMQAKLLLKIRSHCSSVYLDGENSGFRVFERDEGKAMSLGWQERFLITASCWFCVK